MRYGNTCLYLETEELLSVERSWLCPHIGVPLSSTGDLGLPGSSGPRGEPGFKGDKGDTGLPGKPGTMDHLDMGTMKGQKGDQGEKGECSSEGATVYPVQ